MRFETIEARIAQLQKEQTKTRQDEVFGGLSSAERVAYERKEGLIRRLQRQLSEENAVAPAQLPTVPTSGIWHCILLPAIWFSAAGCLLLQ
jgi:hypothetical protein